MLRKVKIVATIGPACDDEGTFCRLVEAGLDVARLNFSHGTHEEHAAKIAMIRKVSEELHKPIGILQDLQGPKLRVGKLPEGGILLEPGNSVLLYSVGENSSQGLVVDGDRIILPLTVPNLAKAVTVGNHILLDDGNLELVVTSTEEEIVHTTVLVGGRLTSNKGVNLPGAQLNIPGFTDKDREDLLFGIANEIDMVAVSFVSRAEDVLVVKEEIERHCSHHIPVIAKLERPEAIDHLDEIMRVADGVMVARGDLGVETSTASVPIMQKRIIESASRQNRFVITATQMLESMINNPRPTRAEASDVANAVFDGTDAVMLSGETATGKYPEKSVQHMQDIVIEAEKYYQQWGVPAPEEAENNQDSLALARASRALARDSDVAAISVFTRSGKAALLVSKVRPGVPIYAFTPDRHTYRQLSIYWGVKPFLIPYATSVKTMVAYVETSVIAQTDLRPGQQMVIISGFPVGAFKPANLALLHTIGEDLG